MNFRLVKMAIALALLSACGKYKPIDLTGSTGLPQQDADLNCEDLGLDKDDPKCVKLEIDKIILSCDGQPNGTSENRIRYESLTVAAGATCQSETQTRTCKNHEFSEWTGTFTHESCGTNSGGGTGAACEGFAHGTVQSRTRYQSASVANGFTCQSETQERSCNNGTFGNWSGLFTHVGCTVAPPVTLAACMGVPHGTKQTQTRYLTETVPNGQTCQSQIQERTCNNGNFSTWTGSYGFVACSMLPPVSTNLPCGTIAHGTVESRIRYLVDSVPNGQTCTSESQARTCVNGNFSAWTGSYAQTNCSVQPPPALASCDGVAHGSSQNRVRFSTASVAFGQTCSQQNQSRTCNNGTWGAWSGSYTFENCNVAQGASCGVTPHLGTVQRTRFEKINVPFGQKCPSEVQTQTCNNGTLSEWTGSFTNLGCTVLPKLSCSLYSNPPFVPLAGASVQITMTSVIGVNAKIDGTVINLSCGGCATTTAYGTTPRFLKARTVISGSVYDAKTGESATCETIVNVQSPAYVCGANKGCGCPTSQYIVQTAIGKPTAASCKVTINNSINGSMMCSDPIGKPGTCGGCDYICLSK